MDIFGRGNSNGHYRKVPLGELDAYSDSSDEGDDFIQQQIRQQRQQIQRQDEGLEMLSQSAQRLGKMSLTIHEELDYHNRMLDDMENDLDKATDNLDLVTRKTKELVNRAGGRKNFCLILALSGVAIVLFWLVLYF